MKTLRLLGIFACFGLMFSGCFTPGFTSAVSYHWRISITNFNENVFFTTILYDHSRIPDFHEEWVHVMLQREGYTHNPYNSFEYDPQVIWFQHGYFSQVEELRFMTMYLNDTDEFGRPDPKPAEREDPYYHREPGKIVIWSLDSIGVYHLEYWPNNTRPKYYSREYKKKMAVLKVKEEIARRKYIRSLKQNSK